MPEIEIAKQVLQQEIKGLQDLENVLDEKFKAVINKIEDVVAGGKGRVIISGMGKSGHIANKICATLASTGTPSFFVHPAEASHGDMGMITKEDVVILLSNSGETAELKDIIAYCKRFGVFLVAMVRRKESTLVDAANVALILPDTVEANDVNAPTTSTTMMLALGDALAVVLLKKRGFKNSDFKVLHPGGKLGAQFTTVETLMHKGEEMPIISGEVEMSEAVVAITSKKFGCAAVVDAAGKFTGIITDGDIRRNMSGDFLNMRAAEVMTRNPQTIRPQALAAEALNIMETKLITSLFILDNDKPIGIVHIHDLLRAGVS